MMMVTMIEVSFTRLTKSITKYIPKTVHISALHLLRSFALWQILEECMATDTLNQS